MQEIVFLAPVTFRVPPAFYNLDHLIWRDSGRPWTEWINAESADIRKGLRAPIDQVGNLDFKTYWEKRSSLYLDLTEPVPEAAVCLFETILGRLADDERIEMDLSDLFALHRLPSTTIIDDKLMLDKELIVEGNEFYFRMELRSERTSERLEMIGEGWQPCKPGQIPGIWGKGCRAFFPLPQIWLTRKQDGGSNAYHMDPCRFLTGDIHVLRDYDKEAPENYGPLPFICPEGSCLELSTPTFVEEPKLGRQLVEAARRSSSAVSPFKEEHHKCPFKWGSRERSAEAPQTLPEDWLSIADEADARRLSDIEFLALLMEDPPYPLLVGARLFSGFGHARVIPLTLASIISLSAYASEETFVVPGTVRLCWPKSYREATGNKNRLLLPPSVPVGGWGLDDTDEAIEWEAIGYELVTEHPIWNSLSFDFQLTHSAVDRLKKKQHVNASADLLFRKYEFDEYMDRVEGDLEDGRKAKKFAEDLYKDWVAVTERNEELKAKNVEVATNDNALETKNNKPFYTDSDEQPTRGVAPILVAVRDKLEIAKRLPGLQISDSAVKDCNRMSPPSADCLERALEALSAYWEARQKKKGIRPDDFFADHHLELKRETPNTMERFRKQRTFRFKGVEVTMAEHFTMRANKDDCIQIHFKLGKDDDSIQIGRVGKHLPNRRRPEQNS